MMIAPDKPRISQAEFNRLLTLPEYAQRRVELFDGEIVEKMPKPKHGRIASIIHGLIFVYLQAHPIGTLYLEAQIEMPDEDYAPIPDMCFVKDGKGEFDESKPFTFMPDLIVEIQSPGQSTQFMREKADYYRARGCRMVIIIYENPIIEVLTPTYRKLHTIDEVFDGGDVLPGFTLPIRQIFPQMTNS